MEGRKDGRKDGTKGGRMGKWNEGVDGTTGRVEVVGR